LRATNTGVTAAVSADGQVLAQLPQFQDGVLTLEVPLTQGRTLYSRLGDWPLYAFCLLTGIMLWWRQRQRSEAAPAAMTTPANTAEPVTVPPVEPKSEHAPAEPPAKERIEPHF